MLKLWINGVDVATLDVKVLRLPPVTVPAKRIERITVPGRSGVLTRWRGDYEAMAKKVVLHYQGSAQRAVMELIQTASTVQFGNEQDRTYACFVDHEIVARRVIADWYEIEVNFVCQPE